MSAVLGLALLVAMFWFAPHDRSVRIFLALALLGSIALPIVGVEDPVWDSIYSSPIKSLALR